MDTKCRSQRCLLLERELTVYNTKITDDSPLSDTFCKGFTAIFQLNFEIEWIQVLILVHIISYLDILWTEPKVRSGKISIVHMIMSGVYCVTGNVRVHSWNYSNVEAVPIGEFYRAVEIFFNKTWSAKRLHWIKMKGSPVYDLDWENSKT